MKRHQTALIAAVCGLFAFAAQADEADGSQHAIQFSSTRAAAEVKAEARNPERISNGGTGYIGLTRSTVSSEAVKAEAARSARNGRTSKGEVGLM